MQPEETIWNESLVYDHGRRRSEICKAMDYRCSWFTRWCEALGEVPNLHRKQWEYVYILQSLWERGCIGPGKKGLVFAVGSEPLPALMASMGCTILATDINPETGREKGWENANQLCYGLDQLNTRGLCDKDLFLERVQYRPVDMNEIPPDLCDFDFNWSSCSFEHLGSIAKGKNFLLNQLNTLKPGGWAVHTTEFNVSSNDLTQDDNESVFYRKRDIDDAVNELQQAGHLVEEVDISMGGLPEDYQVAVQPHNQKVHLKLQVDKFVVTSIGLIIQKKAT